MADNPGLKIETSGPAPATVELQDPLPEANWFWRRLFSFLLALLVLGVMIGLAFAVNRIVGAVVGKIDNMSAEAVRAITIQALTVIDNMFNKTFWALVMVITYYMVAPSAEQITKFVQHAGILKQSGILAEAREARLETPEPIIIPGATSPAGEPDMTTYRAPMEEPHD